MKCVFRVVQTLIYVMILGSSVQAAIEVIEDTHTRAERRINPNTGKSFLVIIPEGNGESHSYFRPEQKQYSRPDYRLLDPGFKKGKILYDGPYSDRTKVYVLAGALAAGGVLGAALAPAAAVGAASTGSGAYAFAGGSAVVSGTAAVVINAASEKKPDRVEFRSQAKQLEVKK